MSVDNRKSLLPSSSRRKLGSTRADLDPSLRRDDEAGRASAGAST